MKGFRADQTLKAATYAFIASQLLSKKEKDDLARVFKTFDKNGDGKLSMDEVKMGYIEHYGRVMSDEDVEKMFKMVDSDPVSSQLMKSRRCLVSTVTWTSRPSI